MTVQRNKDTVETPPTAAHLKKEPDRFILASALRYGGQVANQTLIKGGKVEKLWKENAADRAGQ